jgi:hypothetical protein
MTKAQLAALEKVWIAEIEGRYHHSNAKVMHTLATDGYVVMAEEKHHDRYGSYIVKGWALTHAGRLTYCMSCPEPESP